MKSHKSTRRRALIGICACMFLPFAGSTLAQTQADMSADKAQKRIERPASKAACAHGETLVKGKCRSMAVKPVTQYRRADGAELQAKTGSSKASPRDDRMLPTGETAMFDDSQQRTDTPKLASKNSKGLPIVRVSAQPPVRVNDGAGKPALENPKAVSTPDHPHADRPY